MDRSWRPPVPFRFVAAMAASLISCGANAQGEVRAAYGDWEVRCETSDGGSEHCALMQFVAAVDQPNVGLSVIVLKAVDNEDYMLRVLAPLGVLLGPGLKLRIDGVDVTASGLETFVRCLPNGCVAEATIDEALLQVLRFGKTATFIVALTPAEGIGIPVSLSGFGAGFDALP